MSQRARRTNRVGSKQPDDQVRARRSKGLSEFEWPAVGLAVLCSPVGLLLIDQIYRWMNSDAPVDGEWKDVSTAVTDIVEVATPLFAVLALLLSQCSSDKVVLVDCVVVVIATLYTCLTCGGRWHEVLAVSVSHDHVVGLANHYSQYAVSMCAALVCATAVRLVTLEKREYKLQEWVALLLGITSAGILLGCVLGTHSMVFDKVNNPPTVIIEERSALGYQRLWQVPIEKLRVNIRELKEKGMTLSYRLDLALQTTSILRIGERSSLIEAEDLAAAWREYVRHAQVPGNLSDPCSMDTRRIYAALGVRITSSCDEEGQRVQDKAKV